MYRRLSCGLTLTAGLAIAACGEQPQEQSLQGLDAVASFTTPCNANGFNSLIATYFTPPQQQQVKNYKDAMLAALSANEFSTARTNGYNILREIALAAKGVPQPPAATGSELAVETLRCIVEVTDTNVIADVPDVGYFTNALSHSTGGGFEVRGGTGDPTVAVQAAAGSPLTVISGIAPPAPATPTWWNESLDGQRVLFFGEPGTSESSYHWSVVPRAATFDPLLVITTCVDDEVTNDPTLMLTESDVGVLAFVDAGYIGCGAPPALAMSARRFNLLHHLATLGREILLPEPAAATVVLPGLVGGSAKGVKSLFDVASVPRLNVSLSTNPSPIGTLVANSGSFALTVTTRSGSMLVNGSVITLALQANNGTTNDIQIQSPSGSCNGGTPTAVTGDGNFPTGTITFPKLCITKTGNVTVVVNANVDGRQAIGTAKTGKIKVVPR